MRLAKLSEFRRLVFTPGSAPKLATLRAQIDQIPGGQKRGSRYYVDLDEFDRANSIRGTIEARRDQLRREPLLDGLL